MRSKVVIYNLRAVIFTLLISTFVFHIQLKAQTVSKNRVFNGVVYDAKMKKPVESAEIYFQRSVSVTDINGKYKISVADSVNIISLTVKAFNYKDYIISLRNINPKKITQIDTVFLTQKETDLGQVDVKAKSIYTTIDKTVMLISKDIANSSVNSFDVLKRLPFVNINHEDLISLKGRTDIKYFLNGKKSDLNIIKGIPPNSISKVEMSTTPGAEYDAEGTGGILNIVTKPLKENGYEGTLSGSLGTQNKYGTDVYTTVKSDKSNTTLNYSVSGVKKKSSFLSELSDNGYQTTQNSQRTNKQLYQYIGIAENYQLDTLNSIGASVGYYSYNFRRNSDNAFSFYDLSTIQNSSNYNNTRKYGVITDLDYNHTFKDETKIVFSFENFLERTKDSTLNQLNLNYNSVRFAENTLQVKLENLKISKINLQAGAKFISRDNFSNSYYGNDSLVKLDYSQKIYAVFGTAKFKLSKVFSTKIGLRAEWTKLVADFSALNNLNNTNLNLFPSAIISASFKNDKIIKLSYDQSIQRPGIDYLNPYVNRYDPQNVLTGNPNLRYEQTHNVNLSYSFNIKACYFETGFYYAGTFNSISTINSKTNEKQTLTSFINAGKQQNYGYDISVGGDIAQDWAISSSLYLERYYIQYLSQSNRGSNLQFNVSNTFKLPASFILLASFSYTSRQPTLQGFNGEFFSDDIRFSKRMFNKKFTAMIGVEDPLNISGKYTNFWQDRTATSVNRVDFQNRRLLFSLKYSFGKRGSTDPYATKIFNDDLKNKKE